VSSNQRQVLTNPQNKDLDSLIEKEANAEILRRPPMQNLQRKNKDRGNSRNKKKQAIESLLKDKVVATELIRLYTNVSDLRESQKKLAIATGLKPPRPKTSKRKQVSRITGRFAANNTSLENKNLEQTIQPQPNMPMPAFI
jgi:hypothetical protein